MNEMSQQKRMNMIYKPPTLFLFLIKRAEALRVRMFDSPTDYKKENRLMAASIRDYEARWNNRMNPDVRKLFDKIFAEFEKTVKPIYAEIIERIKSAVLKKNGSMDDARLYAEVFGVLSLSREYKLQDKKSFHALASDMGLPRKEWVQDDAAKAIEMICEYLYNGLSVKYRINRRTLYSCERQLVLNIANFNVNV